MIELTEEQIALVSGGLKWDSRTCGAAFVFGGVVVGATMGGWAGAGAGYFVGDWLGDNICPSSAQ